MTNGKYYTCVQGIAGFDTDTKIWLSSISKGRDIAAATVRHVCKCSEATFAFTMACLPWTATVICMRASTVAQARAKEPCVRHGSNAATSPLPTACRAALMLTHVKSCIVQVRNQLPACRHHRQE